MPPFEMSPEMLEFQERLNAFRGRGLFRGRIEYLSQANQIRIEKEARGDAVHQGEIRIHLEEAGNIFARIEPGSELLSMKACGNDPDLFIGKLLERARGKAYIKSYSASAAYRHEGETKDA